MSDLKHGGAQLAEAVKRAYAAGQDDYHLEPMVLTEQGVPVGKIQDGDSVIFCCRRGEREIELTEMFTDPEFNRVPRRKPENLYFAIMTLYHDKFKDLPIAFAPSHVVKPLAQVLSDAGKTQFHCSESEKFAHVTFFFNGGENQPFPGEKDTCIPSPKGISFDEKPELSLPGVADTVMDALGKYDFIVTNFANGDVIGHTANSEAKIEACAHVSRHLDRVVHDALAKDYVVSITADCDSDALVVEVVKDGPACHTGEESCFFNQIYLSEELKQFSYEGLYELIRGRRANPQEGSYTTYLFEKGLDKILKKVGEECTEVIIAGRKEDREETVYEIADLAYHVMVLMVQMGISVEDVTRELEKRHVVDHKVKQERMQ